MVNTMHSLLNILFASLLTAGLAACSVSARPNSLEIQRLIVVNESARALDEVKIYVAKIREFVSCGYILANSECSIGFPLREYQGNRFDVSWIDNGRAKWVKDIRLSEEENLMSAEPVNAVIT